MPKRREPRPEGYGSALEEKRGNLRRYLRDTIRELKKDSGAEMYYTPGGFYRNVVRKEPHLVLDGWPKDVIFTNLSDVPGGIRTIERLLGLWERGEMGFREIKAEEAAGLDEISASPGPYTLPPLWTGRSDIKKHRRRPVTNPEGLMLKRAGKGPKSAEYVLDDGEQGETLEAETEGPPRRRKRRRMALKAPPKSSEFVEDSE